MHSDCLSEHIFSNAPHLNGVSGEETTSVDEGWPLKGDWVVSLVHDQHSNDPLISIDDEVASELKSVFLSLGELFLGQAIEIAVLAPNHDWDFSQANGNFFFWLVIKLSSYSSIKWCLVGQRPEPALIGQHFINIRGWPGFLGSSQLEVLEPDVHLLEWVDNVLIWRLGYLRCQHVLIYSWQTLFDGVIETLYVVRGHISKTVFDQFVGEPKIVVYVLRLFLLV